MNLAWLSMKVLWWALHPFGFHTRIPLTLLALAVLLILFSAILFMGPYSYALKYSTNHDKECTIFPTVVLTSTLNAKVTTGIIYVTWSWTMWNTSYDFKSNFFSKICDLGSARSLEHTARQTTAVGTYAWMAPEVYGSRQLCVHSEWLIITIVCVWMLFSEILFLLLPQMLRREKVSKSCDVYSYGVLLFEIATQQQPFPDVLPVLVPGMTMEGKVGDSAPLILGNTPTPFCC